MLIDVKRLKQELARQGIRLKKDLPEKEILSLKEMEEILKGSGEKAERIIFSMQTFDFLTKNCFPVCKEILDKRAKRDPFIL
jgi:hypothetical protein